MLKETFGTQKPIIAMVHLQHFRYPRVLAENAFSDIEKLQRGGADALLFENWGGERSGRHATPQVRDCIIDVMKKAARKTDLPLGVNVLSLDYEASFEIAKATGATFVQLDTLVDKLKKSYDSRLTFEIDPVEVISYRKKLGLEKVVLMTNIQTKHYVTVPKDKPLETSAKQAIESGSDAIVVTGSVTGEKTPLERILRAKIVAGKVPVLVGSGLDVGNATELMTHADGAIVGTSLKQNGLTENPVDEERVRALIDVVRKLR